MPGDKGFCVNLCHYPFPSNTGKGKNRVACNKYDFAISVVKLQKSAVNTAEVRAFIKENIVKMAT